MNAQSAPVATRILLALACTLCSTLARADDPWVGRKFMPRLSAKAMVGDKEMRSELHNVPLTVTRENGDWAWIGKAWVRKDQIVPIEQAAAYYTEHIRRNPHSVWGYDMRGSAYKDQGDFDKAIKDFSTVIKMSPKDAWGYVARGSCREARGELESALKDYAAAMRVAPKSPVPLIYRAVVWGERNDFDKAMADYDEAIRLDPKDSATAHFNRGLLNQKWGHYKEALADYADTLEAQPDHAGALACRARIRATCPDEQYRDGKLALEEAKRACELSQWGVEAWIDSLAAAYAETGDFDQAVKYQEQALQLLGTTEHGLYTPAETKARLELYRSRMPYRETPKAKPPARSR
ncbi:MAG: tetratricopeptide repeat protein [Planctomycetia bacterium]|nr:tetratricopeptide repeat protein [Planctomycetia bacterium]